MLARTSCVTPSPEPSSACICASRCASVPEPLPVSGPCSAPVVAPNGGGASVREDSLLGAAALLTVTRAPSALPSLLSVYCDRPARGPADGMTMLEVCLRSARRRSAWGSSERAAVDCSAFCCGGAEPILGAVAACLIASSSSSTVLSPLVRTSLDMVRSSQ